MTGDRVLYFGFSIMFLSILLFVIALIMTQPVILYFEADIQSGVGDTATIENIITPTINTEPLKFTNPVTGKTTDLFTGTSAELPSIKVDTALNKFNVSIHIKGQVEAPVYVLALAAYSKMSYPKPEIGNYTNTSGGLQLNSSKK